MKKILKSTMSMLTVTTVLLGGIASNPICSPQIHAVYDRKLWYDPDAEPNYDAVNDLESLRKELQKLHWFNVCPIDVGHFEAKGFFGIVRPRY